MKNYPSALRRQELTTCRLNGCLRDIGHGGHHNDLDEECGVCGMDFCGLAHCDLSRRG